MNLLTVTLAGAVLTPLPSGALHWADEGVLVVSDLHLGKSERIARRSGALLPPYETAETLDRLAADLARTGARRVICLGDSFDDTDAGIALDETHRDTIRRLQSGRDWDWIEGNHDPGPVDLGGSHRAELVLGPLTFRHIAKSACAVGEISGHYHPKARVRAVRRPCFMLDARRMVLPAYGCYTGGLDWTTPILRGLFDESAIAYLTGPRVVAVPVPRAA